MINTEINDQPVEQDKFELLHNDLSKNTEPFPLFSRSIGSKFLTQNSTQIVSRIR